MGKGRIVGAIALFAMVGAVVLLPGCAASRAKDRMRVVAAENADLIQRTTLAEQRAREAQLGQDRTLTDLQVAQHQAAQLEDEVQLAARQAAAGQAAVTELQRSRDDNLRQVQELDRLKGTLVRLEDLASRSKPAATPPPAPPGMDYVPSEALAAFRRDLQGRLSAAGINLPVEMRTSRDGRQRVAVVLRNAFPSGKDSLTYNMEAVKAVVGVGKLVASSYPGSTVGVEGHTDSDPIRRSPFRSNDHLSEARAEAVRKLLERAGVPGTNIEVIGMGARHPIDPGTTKRAKAQNRRVEIYIEPRP